MRRLKCYVCLAVLLITGRMPARAAGDPPANSAKIAITERAPAMPRTLSSPEDLSQLEKQLWAAINEERLNPANQPETGANALPLKWNEKLAAMARAYSEDMLTRGFYAHVNPEGQTPAMRVAAAGIPWQAEGENLAIYNTAAGAQAAFMDEPRFEHNHRSNILSAKYTDVGVGIVRAPNGMYYITEEFVKTPTDEFVAAQSLAFGAKIGHAAAGR